MQQWHRVSRVQKFVNTYGDVTWVHKRACISVRARVYRCIIIRVFWRECQKNQTRALCKEHFTLKQWDHLHAHVFVWPLINSWWPWVLYRARRKETAVQQLGKNNLRTVSDWRGWGWWVCHVCNSMRKSSVQFSILSWTYEGLPLLMLLHSQVFLSAFNWTLNKQFIFCSRLRVCVCLQTKWRIDKVSNLFNYIGLNVRGQWGVQEM